MLTTLALNAAELNTSVCTEFVAPNAKLLIETPVNTINTSFNSRYLGFSVALLLVGLLGCLWDRKHDKRQALGH